VSEAFTAEDGSVLCRAKGDGGLLAALRTSGASLDTRIVAPIARRRSGSEYCHAFRLAGFTALGFVLEPFVVEKQLFPGGKDEFDTAVDAGQYLVLKFH
jgi:hypothetical protein